MAAQTRSWRLLDILLQTAEYFAARGLENARLQAELLLADVLHLRRLDLYLQFERLLTTAEVDAYREHVRRRAQRLPLQYVTGRAAFRELDLVVTPDVLIPRPETEVLVQVALDFLASREAPRILDLGCGSGAIGLAIACEHATAHVLLTDVSAAALAVARTNAQQHGLEERVAFLCGDLFAPLLEQAEREPLDAVVSNPPYVATGEIEGLQPEVRDHEPRLALDAGPDGLEYYRRIASQAWELLCVGGGLFLEVGGQQAGAVQQLLSAAGRYMEVQASNDLNRVPRVVSARRAPS